MKTIYCVVVADGSRARIFSFDELGTPSTVSRSGLVEQEDLVNPEHELAGREKYSATRTGVNLNPGKGPTHGYDDHRDQEEQEHERRFARDIAHHALQRAQQCNAGHLLIVAEKHMLGLLRDAVTIPPHSGIELHELAKDLTRLAPNQLHDHLADAGLVPPRSTPATA